MRISQDDFLGRFPRFKRVGKDKFMASSPLRSDSSPSVSIRFEGDAVLINDFGGDSTREILDAIGLTFADISPERPSHHRKKPGKPWITHDLVEAMSDDLYFVMILANSMAKGVLPQPSEVQRAIDVSGRFQRGLEIVGFRNGK